MNHLQATNVTNAGFTINQSDPYGLVFTTSKGNAFLVSGNKTTNFYVSAAVFSIKFSSYNVPGKSGKCTDFDNVLSFVEAFEKPEETVKVKAVKFEVYADADRQEVIATFSQWEGINVYLVGLNNSKNVSLKTHYTVIYADGYLHNGRLDVCEGFTNLGETIKYQAETSALVKPLKDKTLEETKQIAKATGVNSALWGEFLATYEIKV